MILTASSILKNTPIYFYLQNIIKNYRSLYYNLCYNIKLTMDLNPYNMFYSTNRYCLVCNSIQTTEDIVSPCWSCQYIEFNDMERAYNILVENNFQIGQFPIVNIRNLDDLEEFDIRELLTISNFVGLENKNLSLISIDQIRQEIFKCL